MDEAGCGEEMRFERCVSPCHIDGTKESGGLWHQDTSKAALLEGKSADAVQRVVEKMKFTPGARLVCGALRAMGCRLAILSSHGVQQIDELCKNELGIDYVMCNDLEIKDGRFTGRFSGDAEVRFRKSDLLKLMADREGIEYKNVIVIGEFLEGLIAPKARTVLETFGLNVYFNAEMLGDLAIALYLLGFNGVNVNELRGRFEPASPFVKQVSRTSQDDLPNLKRFMIEISTQEQQPGMMKRILASLLPFGPNAGIATVRACSLHEGGMCVGLDLRASGDNPDKVCKELLYACHVNGYQTKMREPNAMPTKTKDISMHHYSQNRYIITYVQIPTIDTVAFGEVLQFIASMGVNVVRLDRMCRQFELTALQLTVILPENLDVNDFSTKLRQLSQQQGADLAIQKDDVDRWMRRMVVFDMDTTLVEQDTAMEMAKVAGVEQETAAIIEATRRGEISYSESLKRRVALLKGFDAEDMWSKCNNVLSLTPGAKRLCGTLKKLGYKTAVISGSFLPVAQEVQNRLELTYAFANVLEVDENTGQFTGQTGGPIVTPERKRNLLATMANVEGCEVQQTVAVGAGVNDIPMLQIAGLGIAFCSRPAEKEGFSERNRINHTDLSLVLYLIGLSEHAVERLGGKAGQETPLLRPSRPSSTGPCSPSSPPTPQNLDSTLEFPHSSMPPLPEPGSS